MAMTSEDVRVGAGAVLTRLGKLATAAAAIWAIVLMLISGAVTAWRAWGTFYDELTSISQGVQANGDAIEEVRLEVAILQAPADIVAWSQASRVEENCYPGGECLIFARVRREVAALDCDIIPGRTEFTFTSYVDFTPRTMNRTGTPRGSNVGPSYELLEIPVSIPRSAPIGDGEVRVSTFYTNCPWQTNGRPPVEAESPALPITIVPRPIPTGAIPFIE